MIFFNENDFRNQNIAIFGGSVDNFGRRYENQLSKLYSSLDAQPEIQILNWQDLEQTDADSVYLMKTHLNLE